MSFKKYIKATIGSSGDLPLWQDRRDLVFDWLDCDEPDMTLEEVLDELKWDDLDERTFLIHALQDGEWKYEDYRPRKAYHIQENHLEVDQYVNQLLKRHYPETKERIKGYTRSGRLGRAYHTLLKFGRPLHKKTNLMENKEMYSIFQDSKLELKNMLLKANDGNNFQTIPLADTLSQVPLNTSAGYTYPGKKKIEVAKEALNHARSMFFNISKGRFQQKIPCKLAVRGHLSPIHENKSRPVWVMPFETILLECKLFNGVYKMLKPDQTLPFITGDGSMHRLWKYLNSNPRKTFVSTDMSAWDTMRGRFLIYEVFDIFSEIIDMTEDEKKLFKWIVHDYVQTHLILPSGIVISKTSGIPSGTYLTLLFNSCINWLCQNTMLKYISQYHDSHFKFCDMSILGDDNGFFCNYFSESLSLFYAENMTRYFGLLSSAEKFNIYKPSQMNERKFLGYNYNGLLLYRSTDEWFRFALLPEREVKDLSTSFTRVFSYLLIGGINDPFYVEFFEKYVNVYYDAIEKMSNLKKNIFQTGSLRVFKHAFNIDLEFLANVNIKKLLSFNYFMLPLMFSCNYDIKHSLSLNTDM